MFRKRRQLDPADKAADREDREDVQKRLSEVERRVTILQYQLTVMRRDHYTTGGVA